MEHLAKPLTRLPSATTILCFDLCAIEGEREKPLGLKRYWVKVLHYGACDRMQFPISGRAPSSW